MADRHADITLTREESWLKQYYFVRTAFSAAWVALAFSLGQHSPARIAALLVVYPAWDALANYIDMLRSGGAAENRTQVVNVGISIMTTVAVIVALKLGAHGVLGVFGVWAILAGLLQLGTAVRRWKRFGAQWAMILSGGQSALAGVFFIVQGGAPLASAIDKVAGYAAVGAVYFLISALWLSAGQLRSKMARTS
ncbi:MULTISPECIES: DUF308 domain-containing protein [unclassified Paraburkholderia]|uniref:DUF308 domain-containing protein n=1 Tax=unclassified Paraburkholderia TaxID=2615204 RepID=UPI0020B7322D|nr:MULTISPECIES: DUF308 domain-containing protein [unclassified Paraburkholderia]MCP3716620.1 DUF308 domain-containing protein [Paraburkholderia sp. CNPSo 3281]MCX5539172.1 DUF308 domain-containing protein [Paraburkholderia sp. CNPSo 3076]